MAIKLTVKEGSSERSWDVVNGQQIDIHMAQDAHYDLIDTQTGRAPDGLRITRHDGQIEIYGSDSYPWVTMHHGDTAAPPQPAEASEPAAPPPAQDILATSPAEVVPPQEALPVEHLRADEVAETPPAAYSGGEIETPSMGSMLLAGGGALVVGGMAALVSGGSDGGDGIAQKPVDTPRDNVQGYTLQLNNEMLDMTRVARDGKLDLDNGRNDLLKLSAQDLLGDPAQLTIDGNHGDNVQLAGHHWTQLADEGKYHVYQHNNLIARIEDDISVTII
ncbi:MAG: hypothetical protein D8H94_13715 [Cardiobacterium sp.]|nr:MAG: hypothetical protein D8H94_13715 [Cardiobacterium sp.]